jgi:hypothetical protein
MFVCLMALGVAKADATTPVHHCTSIANVNGHAVAGIIVAAQMSQGRLAAICANITLTTPGNWTNHPGTRVPAGWKIGDKYRNSTGELVEIAASPKLLPSVDASLVPLFSSQDGWQRVG